MEKLVDLVPVNPDIGRGKLQFGYNKMQLKEKWDRFTIQLIRIRSTKEWQRVWTYYKANLKRKLAANKKNVQATGGGPSAEISLSPLEQSTVELVSMQSQVNPSGSAMGLQMEEDSDAVESSIDTEEPSPMVRCTTQQLPTRHKGSKNKPEDNRLAILKMQAKIQEGIMHTLKRMEKNSYKNYVINKKCMN